MQEQRVQSEETLFNLGWFASKDKVFYTWLSEHDKTYFSSNSEVYAGGIAFKMSPDRIIHKRCFYNFFDFLASVGGLWLSLTNIAAFLLLVSGLGGDLIGFVSHEVFKSPALNERAKAGEFDPNSLNDMEKAYSLAAQRRKFRTVSNNFWVRLLCRSKTL